MKVGVICAFPAGSNTGMLSVDLAFDSLVSKIDKNISVTRFCPWRALNKTDRIPLEYVEYTTVDQLMEFDHIIFWGDFLHWITYAEHDWSNRGKNKNPEQSQENIIDSWYDLCLLENNQELRERTIIVGGTVYGLNANHLTNQRYITALKNLYRDSRSAMVRDFFSRYFLEQIVQRPIKVSGDCALLLDSHAIISAYPETKKDIPETPYAVYAFGRSGSVDVLERYAQDIAEKAQIKLVKLDWLKKGTGIRDLARRVNLIKNAEFIITDIYHCAVNSYREKKPVICIGLANSRIKDTLSDKKKEVLHFQLFAQTRYRYLEDVVRAFDKEVMLALETLGDHDMTEIISDLIDAQISSTVSHLTEVLDIA